MSANHQSSQSSEEPKGYHWAVIVPALVVFLFVTFPGGYLPMRPGLDPSWRYAVNYLPHSGVQYGTDVAFTYGPLGFLLYPMDILSNLAASAAFRFIVHLVFGIAVGFVGLRLSGVFPALLFMASYILAMVLGLQYESHLIVVGAILAGIATQHFRAGNFVLPPLAVLAAMSLFIKPTLAVSLTAMLCLAEMARMMLGYTGWYSLCIRSVAPFAAVAGVLWLRFFGAWEPFQAWLIMTIEFARYNAIAMALEGPRSELLAGAACLLAFLAGILILMGMRSEVSVAGMVFLPALLILFKHGFERQDGHVLFFFAPCIGFVGVLLLLSRQSNEMGLTCLLLLATALPAIPVASARNAVYYAGAMDLLSGRQGLAHVRALANLSETRQQLAAQSDEHLASLRLPRGWKTLIMEQGGAMDVLPWEIAYSPANGIPWHPNPTVQSYVAYTAFLDRRLASHFSSDSGPRFLLIEWTGFEQRHLPYDVPAAWRALLKHYRLVDIEQERNLLLLVRRALPIKEVALPSKERTLLLEQWMDAPSADGVVLAAPQFRLTRGGHLAKAALRIPPVYLEFEYGNGEQARTRILPESAANGIVVNRPPLEFLDAVNAFSELPVRSVTRFRITGPGTRYFAPEMPMTLTQTKTAAHSDRQLAQAHSGPAKNDIFGRSATP